jgi:hypothetical protein
MLHAPQSPPSSTAPSRVAPRTTIGWLAVPLAESTNGPHRRRRRGRSRRRRRGGERRLERGRARHGHDVRGYRIRGHGSRGGHHHRQGRVDRAIGIDDAELDLVGGRRTEIEDAAGELIDAGKPLTASGRTRWSGCASRQVGSPATR